MSKRILQLILIFFCSHFRAQTFEVDQIQQLFRPRLRVDSKYIFDSKYSDTSGVFNQKEGSFVCTFPIKTKISADLKLDLSSIKLKDIIKNSVRLKASQTLGTIRVNARQANFGFDTLPQKNLNSVTAGLIGLNLTKKHRVLFYSASISVSEQDKTLHKSVPRATGLIGQLHIRGLRKNYFYGVAAGYSDGLFLPAVFFGGSEPIGKRFIFNYILPVQINIQYKDDRKTLITLGITADGYRTGINHNFTRVNVNYSSVSLFSNVKYRFNKTFVVRVEAGYMLYQNLRYTQTDMNRNSFNINPGPYVQVGFNVLFGKTVWEKIFEGVSGL